MRARDEQRLADVTAQRVAALLADYGEWVTELRELAKVGYPSGGDGARRSSDVSDPTFAAAFSPDPMRAERRAHDADWRTFVALVAKFEKRRAFVLAKGLPTSDPGPVVCENEACGRRISGEGSDKQREGLCPRCYQHSKRHGGLSWPTRTLTPAEAERLQS